MRREFKQRQLMELDTTKIDFLQNKFDPTTVYVLVYPGETSIRVFVSGLGDLLFSVEEFYTNVDPYLQRPIDDFHKAEKVEVLRRIPSGVVWYPGLVFGNVVQVNQTDKMVMRMCKVSFMDGDMLVSHDICRYPPDESFVIIKPTKIGKNGKNGKREVLRFDHKVQDKKIKM